MSVLENLQPQLLWQKFDEIRKIPRESGHEEKIIKYLENFALKHKFEYKKDQIGNIVIKKPATPGYENSPGVILQGHVDMVCEKNSDKEFNFSTDPIEVLKEGDWITANGTTLGADNGIGVAAGLAVLLSDDISHGPLEVLCTVDEERGLTGAFSISEDFLAGKYLLNLDSEEEGYLIIGCAGGQDSIFHLPVELQDAQGQSVQINIKGLKGGHSGCDINTGRANSIKILAHLLKAASTQFDFNLIEINAGSKRNAIPREAFCKLSLNQNFKLFSTLLNQEFLNIKKFTKDLEPEIKIEISKTDSMNQCLSNKISSQLINLLCALPHGVLTMSQAVAGLVQTSTNLAIVKTNQDEITIEEMTRSSNNVELKEKIQSLQSFGDLLNIKVSSSSAYPGWQPHPESEIVQKVSVVYKKLFNKEPKIEAIHAGLETGIIGEKFPEMEMISFGPDLFFPHSPDEKVSIPSVQRFWELLVAIMKDLK